MDGKYIKAVFKVFLIMAMGALLIQIIAFGIYWYNRRNFGKNDNFKKEKDRCEQVIASDKPDFKDYSYCKNFLEWVKSNINP